jgi:hypothetical protein
MKRLEKRKPSLKIAVDSCNTFARDIAGIDELAFEIWKSKGNMVATLDISRMGLGQRQTDT